MSLNKSLLTILSETSLQKKEDPQAYAKLASKGTMLGHPVTIRGETHRSDNKIPYHATIKFFNPEKDSPHKIHEVASKLQMHTPHPELTHIEPGKLKDRAGNDVYVIKLHGHHADQMKEHHKKFSRMGHKENYEYHPHISVPKEVHDRIKSSGAKTAHEAGIEFHPAELKHGHETVHKYKPKEQKLANSEFFITDLLKSEVEEKLEETKNNETTNSLMNRFEDKYLIKHKHLNFVATTLAERLKEGDIDTEVRYNTNQSIYLDNKDLDAFKEALEEISPRLKVRVRRYAPNDTDWENTAYVELKIKTEDGDTKKTRVRIREEMISEVTSGKPLVIDEELVNINKDITKATLVKRIDVINNIVAKYGFKRQCVVTYKRRAYSNKKIRVTIDDNIKYSKMQSISDTIENTIKNSDNWKDWNKKYSKVREKDFIIVEIKHEEKTPDWIEDLLDKVNAKKIGFSKYCGAIMSYLADEKPVGNISRDIKVDVNDIINQIYAEDFAKSEDLKKGGLKNILTAATMAGALASPQISVPGEHQPEKYDSHKMLNAIAQVESSGGKNVHHRPTSQGTAWGKFALMPSVIHDTIRLNPDLKQKYGKALRLQGPHLSHFMQDNPKLEGEITNRHLQRLEHHFGQDPVKIGYAYNHGIIGTNKAIKEKKDITNHPYVQKILNAYRTEK